MMVVGVLRLDLILHAPQTLKEKRGIVQKLLGRCRSRFPVSAAETGMQDLWQRSEVGIAMVAGSENIVRKVFDQIEEEILRSGLADIGESTAEVFHFS